MMFALTFPAIDPILVQVGPVAVRWYGLAYAAGLLGGWWYLRRLVPLAPTVGTRDDADDYLFWALFGVVLGGRVGYVLFYNLDYYIGRPLDALAIWQGGMSFHGGLLGVIVATILFAKRRSLPVLAFGDRVACVAPVGLFFGRLANFINGELFGRPTDVPWAMVFPRGGPSPRHPSQIYEALLEGLVLFTILWVLSRREAVRARAGTLIGVFLVGYGLARSVVELFRQPDAHIGLLGFGTTMGQWLSLPMVVVGLIVIVWARRASETVTK